MNRFFISMVLLLAACGNPTADFQPAPDGMWVDSTMADDLIERATLVEDCAGMAVDVSALAVVIMPGNSFPCQWHSGGCDGDFTAPNTVRLAAGAEPYDAWEHELVHVMLYQSTGNADSDHTSPLFNKCGHH